MKEPLLHGPLRTTSFVRPSRYVDYVSDKAEFLMDQRERELVRNPSTIKMVRLVERFIKSKKRVLYGGKAINDHLPAEHRFYCKERTIPDYDFYSPTPKEDAIEIADMLYSNQIPYVEVKSSTFHEGTYKVFADFIGIVDVTYLPKETFVSLQHEAVLSKNDTKGCCRKKNNDKAAAGGVSLLLAPPDWLRMQMYQELASPKGDISRWPKVVARLDLLNKYCPMGGGNANSKRRGVSLCNQRRKGENKKGVVVGRRNSRDSTVSRYEDVLVATKFISRHKLVLIGGNSLNLYLQSISPPSPGLPPRALDLWSSEYDVLANDAKEMAKKFRDVLQKKGQNKDGRDVTITKIPGQVDALPDRYIVSSSTSSSSSGQMHPPCVVFYQNGFSTSSTSSTSSECYSYHTITPLMKTQDTPLPTIRVASIETLVQFLLKWFYFSERQPPRLSSFHPFVSKSKLFCAIQLLLEYQKKKTTARVAAAAQGGKKQQQDWQRHQRQSSIFLPTPLQCYGDPPKNLRDVRIRAWDVRGGAKGKGSGSGSGSGTAPPYHYRPTQASVRRHTNVKKEKGENGGRTKNTKA